MSVSGQTRAGQKLAGVLRELKIDFRDKVVLDIGSSTGGFTALALEGGAAKVIAIEKGTGQMRVELAYDSRVELHEKTDIFEVCTSQFCPPNRTFFSGNRRIIHRISQENSTISQGKADCPKLTSCKPRIISTPDIILADVSFVSLRKVLRYARECLAGEGTEFLVLLKPQFEVGDAELHRGVLKNNRVRREVNKKFEQWLRANGFVVLGKRDSGVAGRFGNVERFYHLCLR